MPLYPRFSGSDYRVVSTPKGLYAEYGPPTENQEKIMAQPTYEEGYKQGVEDGTEPITVYNIADMYVNDTLSARRKKLLTKKVTKWIAVFQGDELGLHPEGRFFDTKDTPNQFYCLCANYRGAYPLEIEVPL